jgi:hypothetical protein
VTAAATPSQSVSEPAACEGEVAAQVAELLADAGAVLAPRRREWAASGLAGELAAVDGLLSAIDEVDDWIVGLDNPVGGPLARRQGRRSRGRRSRLEVQSVELAARLHDLLVRIAEEAPPITGPEADRLRAEAARLRSRPVGRAAAPAAAPPGPGSIEPDATETTVLTVKATMTRGDASHPGTLVLTNVRLVFVEQAKSTEIPLAWIKHAQTNAGELLVYQAQRASPLRFTVSSPAEVLRVLGAVLGGR